MSGNGGVEKGEADEADSSSLDPFYALCLLSGSVGHAEATRKDGVY